jgi:hypothetical protein
VQRGSSHAAWQAAVAGRGLLYVGKWF